MKEHAVTQGSPEWLRIRMGKPTASCFDSIVTPGGRSNKPKPSKAQGDYLRDLMAELIMGRPLEGPAMPWMERGKDLEAQAATFYEFQRDIETTVVGFITNDEETMGASPDRLVGDDGLLEIKCPKPEIHVGYLLFDDFRIKYKPQIQGQLYITGRKWVDICSYHPEMPAAIVRVERDEEFIKLLDAELQKFIVRLAAMREELDQRGLLYKPEPARDYSRDFLSDQDVEDIFAARKSEDRVTA